MPLQSLRRDYDRRRQELIEQLQKNPQLDAATQHQIYGAIKEIEQFLKTIEYQITVQQQAHPGPEAPSANHVVDDQPIVRSPSKTKRFFTHSLPTAAKRVVSAPKEYFDRRREDVRLRRELKAEVAARKNAEHAAAPQNDQHVTLEHPHQELDMKHDPLPTWSDETVQKPAVATQSSTVAPVSAELHPADHAHRPHVIETPAKSKSHPSKKAKQGHQHKPHNKRDKYKGSRKGKRR